MLNQSHHLLELLCPVPSSSSSSSLVAAFPALRRYLIYHGRRLPFACWKELRVVALPRLQLHLHAQTERCLWVLLLRAGHQVSLCWALFLFFLFCCSILLAKFLILRSIQKQQGSDTKRVNSNGTESHHSEADVDCYADDWPDDDPAANDVVLEGEALLFLWKKETEVDTLLVRQGLDALDSSWAARESTASESVYASPMESLTSDKPEAPNRVDSPTPNSASADTAAVTVEEKSTKTEKKLHMEEKNFLEGEKDFSTAAAAAAAHDVHPTKKGFKPREEEEENLVGYDSSTVGSTSKSSAEWRSSTNLRDSETEHLFSSSSRRSSSKWESYAVFRKYDEEMMFFDRISAQKLNEAESLRSVKVHPRSISQRIVHKLTTREKHFTRFKDPYRELEAAYVAQICLTWEALNWNYKYFLQLHANQGEEDNGCSAHVAQQFQQFQVLLQRFVENEPYEYGRRAEVYARMRIAAPKLLQVPEFHDSEVKKDKEVLDSRISSAEFLGILEDAIRTFMSFVRADKENHWQKLRALVKKRSSSVDPALLHLLRKVNEKKRRRLKDLIRRGKCPRKRKLREEDEMEILMALTDMKIVSRVLRMPELSDEQLHWCEEKMSRVKVWEGRMQRDSTPLFFPAH